MFLWPSSAPKSAVLALAFALLMTLSAGPQGLMAAPKNQSTPSETPSQLVVLLTDFGERGYLLGALKGTIYAASPTIRIDSISNEIHKFDVQEGAYTLALAAETWPPGTVFLGVVSPDQNGRNRAIAVKTKRGHYFVAPDNGLLTQVAVRYGIETAVRVQEDDSTLPARTLYGMTAAKLARGIDIEQLGSPLKAIQLLTTTNAKLTQHQISGEVVLVDRFGNLVTNISAQHLKDMGFDVGGVMAISVNEQSLTAKWVENYSDVPPMEPLGSINGHGQLKLSLNQGDLAASLALSPGATVRIQNKN